MEILKRCPLSLISFWNVCGSCQNSSRVPLSSTSASSLPYTLTSTPVSTGPSWATVRRNAGTWGRTDTLSLSDMSQCSIIRLLTVLLCGLFAGFTSGLTLCGLSYGRTEPSTPTLFIRLSWARVRASSDPTPPPTASSESLQQTQTRCYTQKPLGLLLHKWMTTVCWYLTAEDTK